MTMPVDKTRPKRKITIQVCTLFIITLIAILGLAAAMIMILKGNGIDAIRSAGLLPRLVSICAALILLFVTECLLIYRCALVPLNRLTQSLSAQQSRNNEVYGCNRNDEIGELAETIQKMRDRMSTYNAELLRAARERERLLRTDQLTEIPNRQSFNERLPLEWGRAIKTQTPVSLLIFDVDFFNNYNNSYGHTQGDKALQLIAQVLAQEIRNSGDLVTRWGEDEFAVLLINTGYGRAQDTAERIRRRIEELPIPLADGIFSKITMSAGINSLTPAAGDTTEDFIRHANMALHTAKKEGRNKVCRHNGVS